VVTVALVTGGAGGIGTAINARLVEAGYTVLAGDLTTEAAHDDGSVQRTKLDVTDAGSVEGFVAAGARLGPIRAVVNCAGVVRFTPVTGFDDADASMLWEINVAGSARVCRAAATHIVDGGAIVNIGSLTGSFGRLEGASLYGATKAGVEAYTRYVACELAPRGIRVNAVAPGFIAVPMSPSMRAVSGGGEEVVKQVPLGRLGETTEVAEVVEFLLSDRASYVTGTTIWVDGGVLAR
jgi:NAD(P)-dependent dehydrogenase (short-subunit alcohol dehydrogenase family)